MGPGHVQALPDPCKHGVYGRQVWCVCFPPCHASATLSMSDALIETTPLASEEVQRRLLTADMRESR
jgi:hypothetical protein